ncbi:MAG: hypothetical protein KTR31_18090 [Myxococcales bacterium]|nr:hypothetical protein [Myxococcales bacterium]
MSDLAALGPVNTTILASLLTVAAILVIRALRQLNRGEVVDALPVTIALVLPLGFAVWAANGQLTSNMEEAVTRAEPRVKQTIMAMMLTRSLLSQLIGAAGTALLAATLMGGALALTVPGDRPRLAVGQAAAGLGGGVVLVALTGMSLQPTALLAVRTLLYVAAVVVVISAITNAHRRGPGMQLGTLAAVCFPIFVAAVDQATMAWFAGTSLREIALAAPTAKQALMVDTISSLSTLRTFSAVHLSLAAGLALLGALSAWRTARTPDASTGSRALAALATVVLVAGAGVGWASNWLAGF